MGKYILICALIALIIIASLGNKSSYIKYTCKVVGSDTMYWKNNLVIWGKMTTKEVILDCGNGKRIREENDLLAIGDIVSRQYIK